MIFFGYLETPFGKAAAIIISLTILIASTIAVLNIPIRFNLKRKEKDEDDAKVIVPEDIDETPEENIPDNQEEPS